MKNYEKPKLMVLSFSANDVLCVGCVTQTRGDDNFLKFDTNNNGLFERIDADNLGIFGNDEPCDTPYTGYCKFTSTNMLFTS